jgi:hypothetical protein
MVEDRLRAVHFLNYGPLDFRWSAGQELANRVNLAALVWVLGFLVGYAVHAVLSTPFFVSRSAGATGGVDSRG